MKMPMGGISFLVSIAQQKGLNDGNTACGKWFYRPVILSTLDTQDLAEHMMDHGSPYGEDVIKGVLEKFFGCAFELLMQNRRIKMGGLGTLWTRGQVPGILEDRRDRYRLAADERG